jgi:hypothetical protein
MPIKIKGGLYMETINLGTGREDLSSSGPIITRDEYDALMSELALKSESKTSAPISEIDEKIRRLEFDMMILVGLVLVVFILCR